MRSSNFGIIPNISKSFETGLLLDIFRRICFSRYFDLGLINAANEKLVTSMVYLSLFGHHGLIGENVPLGVGAALGSGKPVVCIFGDGAAEEDYVFSAMGFAVTHKLPVLFVCEDNNLSILTTVEVRRSWSVTNVAKALGMPGIDITDDPWTIYKKTQELKNNLPAFINIYTCRARWHVGTGVDNPPEWDRFKIVKDELNGLGLSDHIAKIEEEAKTSMEKLWDKKLLQKLSKK